MKKSSFRAIIVTVTKALRGFVMEFDYKSDCPSYLNDFLNYLTTVKSRSALTVKNYYYDLKTYLRFLKIKNGLASKNDFENIRIEDCSEELVKNVTLEDLLEYLTFTADELKNQAKARSRKGVSLRQFYKYLTYTKMWFDVSPAQRLELPTPKPALPKHLTVEQATHLLNQISVIDSWQDARDFCMVTFFLNCGMRLSELVGLNVNSCIETMDFDTGEKVSYIKVLGKGSKERIIYLNSSCKEAYKLCVSRRPNEFKKCDALFLSSRGTRISNRRVEQIIDEKLRLAGLSGMGFSVHKLRHTAATLMYQNGVDVRVLKEVLGHENLGTTQIYTHVANKQLKQAVDKNPLDNAALKPVDKTDDK